METIDGNALQQVSGGFFNFRSGFRTGFRAGVLVTDALGLSKTYSAHVPGMPAGFEKRFIPVVGPMVTNLANKVMPGRLKQWLAGVGRGATVAPGWVGEHSGH
jgi:hypothetical protein